MMIGNRKLASLCPAIRRGRPVAWQCRVVQRDYYRADDTFSAGKQQMKNDEGDLKECRRIMGLAETYDEKMLKDAFLQLAKKYHPDTNSPLASAEKFARVERAYRKLKDNLSSSISDDDVYAAMERDFGIKHTVPQHRHYLSYEGIGYGTPQQRQKQYERFKASRATNKIHEYRTEKMLNEQDKMLISKDAALTRQYKTRQAMERLVEDLIQESMAKGEFDNLAGSGKPLPQSLENPYVDSMTEKLNRILINNGFQPEWVVLSKEIKKEKEQLRKRLREERSMLGEVGQLTSEEEVRWKEVVQSLKKDVKTLNFKIEKYNMLVPTLSKQQLHFSLQKEAQEILTHGESNKVSGKSLRPSSTQGSNQNASEDSFLNLFWNMFRL